MILALARSAFCLVFSAAFMVASIPIDSNISSEYWRETGLKFSTLKNELSDQVCYHSKRSFLACVNVAQSLVPNGYMLKPESLVSSQDKVVESFGPLKLVKASFPERLSFDSLLQRVRSERKQTDQEWLKLKAQHSFSFSKLFEAYRPRASVEADRTAQAFNAFYEIMSDPHTYLMPSRLVADEMKKNSDEFVGIGVQLGRVGVYPTIQQVLDMSPAARAGLRRNDIVLGIDEKQTTSLSLEEAIQSLGGDEGSTVYLRVLRSGKEMRFKLSREKISFGNVSFRVQENKGRRFLYVKIASFMSEQVCEDVKSAIKTVGEVDGTVLDLRDNGGGLLDSAVCISSIFLGPGYPVVQIRNIKSGVSYSLSTRDDALSNSPLVVLVNAETASSSEIVAGSLKDHGRAWIVGEPTWGKGTIQQSRKWDLNDKIVLFKTVARFYLPSGQGNQVLGIRPDFELSSAARAALRESDLGFSVLPPEGRRIARRIPPTLMNCWRSNALGSDQVRASIEVLGCSL